MQCTLEALCGVLGSRIPDGKNPKGTLMALIP